MKREIGSSFYKLLPEDIEFENLAKNALALEDKYTLYYSGRSAFLAVLDEIHRDHKINRIWLPDYFCHNVLNFLKRNYKTIAFYYINPFEFDRDFNFHRFAKKGDVIVLNNFWGLYTYDYNENLIDRPIIIEDHSHGWLTEQSLNSKADYCIASVRKSYPIACGGISWIPRVKLKLNYYLSDEDKIIEEAHKKLDRSNSLKREFLKDGKGNKTKYLDLLDSGEALLTKSNSFTEPDSSLIKELKTYISLNPNVAKSKNLDYLHVHLQKSKHFKIIKRKGYTPFGLLLLFDDDIVFGNFKMFCLNCNIFPANLWPQNDLRSRWKYLFNIHVDFRYDLDDMNYIAESINRWILKNE